MGKAINSATGKHGLPNLRGATTILGACSACADAIEAGSLAAEPCIPQARFGLARRSPDQRCYGIGEELA